jgi:hypothetical protein
MNLPLVAATLAELRALPAPATVYCAALLMGFAAPGDGGGGVFIWSSSSTLPDDTGIVVRPDSAPAAGRWLRDMPGWDWTNSQLAPSIGRVNVKWFGARGDAVSAQVGSDDTNPIQAAIIACGTHGTTVDVFFP